MRSSTWALVTTMPLLLPLEARDGTEVCVIDNFGGRSLSHRKSRKDHGFSSAWAQNIFTTSPQATGTGSLPAHHP
jgi:hypothetical protein